MKTFKNGMLGLFIISTIIFFILIYTNVDAPKTFKYEKIELVDLEAKNYSKADIEKIEKDKKCYELQNPIENIKFLDDIEKSPPKPNKSIFFISTSCINDGLVVITAREACAIESAASQNPKSDVYVLFLSPVGFVPDKIESPLIVGLKSFPNIHFRNVNYYKFSKNTPAEQWIKQDKIFLSPYVKTQMSDYIRFLVLYKFGGVYFDMDFIVVNSLDGIPPNFAPQENWETINASVLGFASNGTGHGMIDMILRESIEKYTPNYWLYNGPGAVIRAIQRICNVADPKALHLMRPEFCDGLFVAPQVLFFPLDPKEAFKTEPKIVEQALKKVTKKTVGIHLWSSQTRNIDILKTGPPMLYTIMAKKFCPKSYEVSGEHFN